MPESRRPRATSRKRVAGQRNRPETKSNRSTRVGLTRPGDPPEQQEQVDGTAEAAETAAGAEADAAGAEPAVEDSASASSPGQSREDESADPTDAEAADRTTPSSAGTKSSQAAGASDESTAEVAGTAGAAGARNSAAGATGAGTARSEDSAIASQSTTSQSTSESATSESATTESTGSALGAAQATASQSGASESTRTESATPESTASQPTATGNPWRPNTPSTEQAEQQDGQRAEPKRSGLPLVAAGFVAAFVLACLAVWFGIETYRSSAATANEALVDQAATSEVKGQMGDAAAKIFSYDFADTGKSEQAAKNLLEGEAIKEYDQLFSTVKEQAPAQKLVVTTTVKASSVLRLEDDRAEVLLFVDQNATRTDNGQNQVGPAQVVFNAKKHGDQWKVTHISQK